MEQQDQTPVQVSERLKKPFQQRISTGENYKPIENNIIAKNLPTPLRIVQTTGEEQELYELWVDTYKTVYPDFIFRCRDPQNAQAHILYSRNEAGKVVSSVRLTIDSPLGMPSDGYYPPELDMYRERGKKLMEFGRLVSNNGNLQLLKTYYKTVYQIAKAENIDVIIMSLKQKDVAFHHNLIGAYSVMNDMKIPHGGKDKISCVVWEIEYTKSRFFRWVGLSKQNTGEIV